jgi:hypothetical protein
LHRHKKKPPSAPVGGELTNAHALHDGTDRRVPHPHEGLIHRSAQKVNSPKLDFHFTAFQEVRTCTALMASCTRARDSLGSG